MPFPVIESFVAREPGSPNATLGAVSIVLPENIVKGDLILVLIAIDQNRLLNIDTKASGTGWQVLNGIVTTEVTLYSCWKIADNFNTLIINLPAIDSVTYSSFRISGGVSIEQSVSSTTGSTANPDPPSLTPSGGAKDYLWLTVVAHDAQVVATAAPTGFSNLNSITAAATGGVSISWASQNLNASTIDPDPFTAAAEQFIAVTLAVSPANAKKYVFIDTDNGVTTPAGTENGSDGKYHTSSTWPANTATWLSLSNALNNTTIRAITDDVIILCRGTTADTSRAVANSMTCANLTIQGNATNSVWDTTKYRLVSTSVSDSHLEVLTTTITGNLQFKNLQLEGNGSNTTQSILYADGNLNSTNLIDSCIFRFNTSASNAIAGVASGFRTTGDTSCTWNIYNSIFYNIAATGVSSSANGVRIDGSATLVINVYNCIVSNITGGSGIARGFAFTPNNIATLKNCAIQGTSSSDVLNADLINYCATDDTYSGIGNITGLNWANQFEDYTNGDFRLKQGSALIGAGIGPLADSTVPLTDIAGFDRNTQTSDIGPLKWTTGSKIGITSVSDALQKIKPHALTFARDSSIGGAYILAYSQFSTLTPISGIVLNNVQQLTTSDFLEYSNSPAGLYQYIYQINLQTPSITGTVYGDGRGYGCILCDALWISTGFSVGLGLQTINSPTLPPRDINETSNGEGIIPFVYAALVPGVAGGNITITYTNSQGIPNRTAIGNVATGTQSESGMFVTLQAGDTGVRSIQSLEFDTDHVSGRYAICLVRPLVTVSANFARPTYNSIDNIYLTKLFNNTVFFPIAFRAQSGVKLFGTIYLCEGS